MSTLRAGDSEFHTLPTGHVLTATASAAGAGSVREYPNSGFDSVEPATAIGAGASVSIGPFTGAVRLGVACSAGSVEWSASIPAPSEDWSGDESLAGQALVAGGAIYSQAATDGSDVSVALQAEMDALYTLYSGRGGSLVLSSGRDYVAQGLIIPPGVSILGSVSPGTFNDSGTEYAGASLSLPATATLPLLRNDVTRGTIRATTSTGPNPNQRYQRSTIAGLTLRGSRRTDLHTTACDLIHLESAWGVNIFGCQLVNSRGFGIRAIDCNALKISQNSSVYAPWYFDSVADTNISNNDVGGGNGYGITAVWITNESHMCLLVDNIIFNNNGNGLAGNEPRQYAYLMTVGTVSAAADTIAFSGNDMTASTAHKWTDETPVHVFSTGTLPAPLVLGTTYYVKVIDAATIKLATSIRNIRDAVYIDLTTAGTGTITVTVGLDANIALSGDTRRCKVAGRTDQAHGHGIYLLKSPNNLIAGNTVTWSGYGNYMGSLIGSNPTKAPISDASGIYLVNSAGCSIGANMISGEKLGTFETTTAYESRQMYGTNIDTNSTPGTIVADDCVSCRHTAAQAAAGAQNYLPSWWNPRRRFMSTAEWEAFTGSPVIGAVGGARRNAWLFDQATQETIQAEMELMPGTALTLFRLQWVNAGAGAGDVAWNLSYGYFDTGVTINLADQVSSAVTITTAGAQDVLMETQISVNLSAAIGKRLWVRLSRVAADAGDTLANDAGLIGVTVESAD